MNIQWIGSPNYTQGRSQPITKIVIHWMAGTLAATDAVFQQNAGTDRATSAHYGIENGIIHQYVKDSDTAYHAVSANPYSIGIEHSAAPGRPASDATINTSAQLIAQLCKTHNIPIDNTHIIPHSQVVATQCPGTIPIDVIISKAKEGKKMSNDAIEKFVSKCYRVATDVDPTPEQANYWVERIKKNQDTAFELPIALGADDYKGDPKFRYKGRHYSEDMTTAKKQAYDQGVKDAGGDFKPVNKTLYEKG